MNIDLDPVNIAVVAPTGAGKTALISTICDYIKSKTNKAEGFIFEIENKAARELNSFRMKLQANLAAKNIKFDSAIIDPTSECTPYQFSISLRNEDTTIKQSFNILDIPGAFINDPFSYQNDSEYEKFINHLDNSRILWVPIDAAVLMEAKKSDQIVASEIIRRVSSLSDFVKEWSDFAAKNKKVDYCNFVLLKCESYFSQDALHKYKYCQKRFDDSYKPVIDLVKEGNTEDKIACVAVETIGCVRVNSSKWKCSQAEPSCDIEYDVLDIHQQIRGVEALLVDVMRVARTNINEQIDLIKATKSADAIELRNSNAVLRKKYEEDLVTLTSTEKDLTNELEKLREYEVKLAEKGFWDVICNFFDDNIDNLKLKIRKTELHIVSVRSDIEEMRAKIAKLESLTKEGEANLSNVEKEIEMYNGLTEKLVGLTSENDKTEYYRPL